MNRQAEIRKLEYGLIILFVEKMCKLFSKHRSVIKQVFLVFAVKLYAHAYIGLNFVSYRLYL